MGYQCGGTIAEVGADVTDRRVGQRVVATMAHGSHAELAAVPASSTWLVPDGSTRAHANIERLLSDVAAGDLEVVIDQTFPLADAAAAHARMEDRQAFGRVVLVP